MNLVGKILVVLIAVMSLVFASFAVMVYAAHVNWRTLVVNETAGPGKPLGLQVELRTLRESLDALTKQKEQLANAHTSELKARDESKVKARLAWLYPVVGDKPISEIKAPDLLSAIRPLEAAGKAETARRTRSVAGQVIRYAIATGRAENDPTAALRGALAPVQGRHHAAVTEPKAFGALLRAVDGYEGEPVTRAALRLLPLVFVRPGELRHAQWSEVDLDAATWAIPATSLNTPSTLEAPLTATRETRVAP
mgnify:CR=1 FL=1